MCVVSVVHFCLNGLCPFDLQKYMLSAFQLGLKKTIKDKFYPINISIDYRFPVGIFPAYSCLKIK